MKKYFFMLLVAMCAMGMQAQPRMNRYLCVADTAGNVTRFEADSVSSVFVQYTPVKEYVDLGLPSGRLWASYNLGGNAPEDYGYYFAWGETSPKTNYHWNNYKYCTSMSSYTKYCDDASYGVVDNKTVLEAADDAARLLRGTDWRIPTSEDFEELLTYCECEMTRLNGTSGLLVTSTAVGNSATLFFPCAGYYKGTSLTPLSDGYWSASISSQNAGLFHFFMHRGGLSVSVSSAYRFYGFPIRPVYDPQP